MPQDFSAKSIGPKFSGYVQADAGSVRFAGGKNVADIGAKLGGTFQYKGLTAGLAAGVGTTLNAKLSADLNIPINQTMGINIGGSTRADYNTSRNSVESSFSSSGEIFTVDNSVNGQVAELSNQQLLSYNLPSKTSVIKTKYNDKNLTSELHAGLTFGSNKGSVTIGGMLVNRTSLNGNITHNHNHEHNLSINIHNSANIMINNIPDGEQKSMAMQLLEQGAENVTLDGNKVYGNIEQNRTIEYKKTNALNQTFAKPSSEFIGGAYANGQVDLSKNGKWEAFGDISVGKQFNGKGDVQVEGHGGVRFKF